jgi:hypothetical protein
MVGADVGKKVAENTQDKKDHSENRAVQAADNVVGGKKPGFRGLTEMLNGS